MVADEIAATPRDPIPITCVDVEVQRRRVERQRSKPRLSAASVGDDWR